jgi:hypothetical protein
VAFARSSPYMALRLTSSHVKGYNKAVQSKDRRTCVFSSSDIVPAANADVHCG